VKPLVLLQGFYRRGPDGSVPSPGDPADDPAGDWWWDHLARQANSLAQAGFTGVWLPPVTKGNRGIVTDDGKQGDGYDVFDDYDLGSKNQAGNEGTSTMPTRYGTREQLERCVAVMRANGLAVYVDFVHNQRLGGRNCTFSYKGAYDDPGNGRFPKEPSNFHGERPPYAPQDPNVAGGDDDFYTRIGCDCAPINGKPYKYMYDGLMASADWQIRALGAQGFRIDNAKGQSTDFLLPFRNYGAMQGKFAVAEVWDGNPVTLLAWLTDGSGMNSACSVFDFPLKYRLNQMSNTPEAFNMKYLHFDRTSGIPINASGDYGGIADRGPLNAVTFVENHDTESHRRYPDYISQNKWLAYAYILTAEGYPCVFYKDYSEDPGCLGLKQIIDNLIWIHQNIASGDTKVRHVDRGVFAFERTGVAGPPLLVALSTDMQNMTTIAVETGFGGNVLLHDYTGNSPDVWTDAQGRATIDIRPNAVWSAAPDLRAGGYACYSVANMQAAAATIPAFAVTQEYEGAADLDIRPAEDAGPVQVCRIDVERNTAITGTLRYDSAGLGANTRISLVLSDPLGSAIATENCTAATNNPIDAIAPVRGTYTFSIQSFDSPLPAQRHPYTLSATYTAPTTLP
jgi:alpha-amylase